MGFYGEIDRFFGAVLKEKGQGNDPKKCTPIGWIFRVIRREFSCREDCQNRRGLV